MSETEEAIPFPTEYKEAKKFLEIETKYNADGIDRLQFKALVKSFNPKSFLYVESSDVYYTKGSEFLRYRMPAESDSSLRAELTFKKKHVIGNNVVRTEVNLRIDANDKDTVSAFCEGLGYKFNFSVFKFCDIYFFEDVNLVYYSVRDKNDRIANFLEIEVNEELNIEEAAAKELIVKYEKLLAPLGLTPHKRMKKSLFEIYVQE